MIGVLGHLALQKWAPDPPGENGWRFFGGILVLALLVMLWNALCGFFV